MAHLKHALALLGLLVFSSSHATLQPPTTLHVPVFHRDTVFPPPPDDVKCVSLLSRRLAADAARYAALVASLIIGSLTAHDDDHLHSPVISGLPFASGEYFASVGVGTPPTPALLVIDTGSDVVWLQCKPCVHCYRQLSPLYDPRGSSTYAQTPCSPPQCRNPQTCDGTTGGCGYRIVYGDASSTSGNLATDRLVFSNDTSVGNVTLGCGHDNEGLFGSAAGLLGVARGNNSFATQVADSYGRYFAYCLGDRTRSGSSSSYLVFGRTAPEPPSSVFTPLRSNPRRPSLYYVDMVGFSVGGEPVTGFSNASLSLDPATGRGGVVVDSGTSITRFARDAYGALRDAFDARAAKVGMRKVGRGISVFDACYDLRGVAVADAPGVVLHFAGGADVALPPENYLVPEESGRYHCFALEAAGHDGLSVIGNVLQQRFRVVFDVENERVGFEPNGC
ncbi:hypothetical protein BRADI_2g48400v3 [Brachypodium distachyon]|uniref:Peptidase A1 domain-containing protein n=2 Tax=Brachypodium distachyon TaxID=15368 RepID=I1HR15_BRADI|nr:hypothetical protein BRADI_2g48400v3 [Brachypodium distachyon]